MTPSPKRRLLLLGIVAASVGGVSAFAEQKSKTRVIKITAKRFQFTPSKITLNRGEAVILEFSTLDVPMGFSAPAFKVRTNILPDQPAQVQFTPEKSGQFDFFCDIVCGDGHKDMVGSIIVS